ncbi:MAG TPA: hypothetical protein VLV54_16720 [Thermoanaerobaculia bacterium]|nr:hypothetical protein [Thermoanaerobaculia bacterium]
MLRPRLDHEAPWCGSSYRLAGCRHPIWELRLGSPRDGGLDVGRLGTARRRHW